MTAVIVCNGNIRDYSYYGKFFRQARLVICVDGGARHMRNFDLKPDILVGDFDSINKDDYEYYVNKQVEILKFPVQKDLTDTELAVNIAINKGCRHIIFIGCLGSRLDHTLSNIFLLKLLLDKGITGIVTDENNEITLIKDSITLKREENTRVSLVPLSETVEGITLSGLYYPLDNASVELGSAWGVSNEFAEDSAQISIKKGLLLVIKARD
ncbi:MAG: thiamine diphosphokinase [Bacillota bacterium]|nr:thiamine diphosphokinase [Bacillota bacterium]